MNNSAYFIQDIRSFVTGIGCSILSNSDIISTYENFMNDSAYFIQGIRSFATDVDRYILDDANIISADASFMIAIV